MSAVELLARIDDLSRVRLAGVYTHMHSFGGPDARDYARWQFDRFLAVLEQARARDRDDLLLMASSSFAMQMTADMNLNAVDPGHLVFGLHPPGPTDALPGLRQAIVELTSRFVQVKDVERSAFTSCAPFPPAGVRRIGVLPIGRADGFHLVNAGHVLVGARRAPILGDVMAEYARVDLTGIAAGVGDEAVAIGCRGGAAITPEDVAGHQRFRGPADIPLSVSPRVHRSYQQADGAPLSDRTSSHPEARELL
jgi:alanine racemase